MHRRRFISGFAAAGLGSLAASRAELVTSLFSATPPASRLRLIDVHHHMVPPFYLSENREGIIAAGGGRINPAYFSWTPDQSLEAMDRQGIATAILSLSVTAFWFGDRQAAVRTARRVNEYAADLVRSHRGRFGMFALIPVPDTEASLREIEYAYSILKAGGVALVTSYGDKWLGHSDYEPVFEELDRRKSVVFVHLTSPLCCRTLLPQVSPILIEFRKTPPAPLPIFCLRVHSRNLKTFASSSLTRAEMCPCCSVVCTNMRRRTSPKTHQTESNMN